MRTSLIALLIVGLSPLLARAAEEQPRIVSTQGEAIVYVVPDEVILNFGVETVDKVLDTARAANDQACAKLLKAVKDVGIEEKHIQADHMNVSIRYSDRNNLVVTGYEARRTYSVVLKDVKKFETLVDTVLKNGANRFDGYTFQTSELRKHRDKARAMAIQAAREKATDLAKALDCKVGHPRTISEGGGSYAYWGGANRYANWNNMAQNSVQVMPGGGEEGGDTMPLGQIAIRANVSVTFDLVP
ncbi:MAG: SIMPL domain-containing protein [Tepidisphaeraceae bacterium]